MGIVRAFIKNFSDVPVRFGNFDSYTQVDTDGVLTYAGLKDPAGTALTSTAAELNILDGVTSTAAELNIVDNICASISITYAPSTTTDGIEFTFTVLDAAGVAIAAIHQLTWWISDDADGSGLTAADADGALTEIAGTLLAAYTAKKHIIANTDANGVLSLLLVDSANSVDQRFCCVNPVNGKIVVGAATIQTDYEGGVIP